MTKLHVTILAILGGALCFAAGLGFNYFRNRMAAKERGIFNARTVFVVYDTTEAPDLLSARSRQSSATWLHAQAKIISSQELLQRTVKRLNLDQSWHMTTADAAERMQKRLDVELDPSSATITVTMWSNKNTEAAEVANGVREAYEEFRMETEEERFRRLTQTVEAQIKNQSETVEKTRLEMMDLQKRYNIVDTAPFGTGFRSAEPPDPKAGEEQRQGQMEYGAAKQKYEASIMLLNTMRELSARQKVDLGVVKKPIEVLEVARPPVNPANP